MHVKLVTAILDIKSLYAITKNWQGDPFALRNTCGKV